MAAPISLEDLTSIVRALADRLELVEAIVSAAPATKAKAKDAPTDRVRVQALVDFNNANPGVLSSGPDDDRRVTGVYAYDVKGRDNFYVERDTGLHGFWITTARGKRLLVDIIGVPFFLDNPLRANIYADFYAAHPELPAPNLAAI